MALIKCPVCKGQVSDTAESCPHCGYIISKSKGLKNSFIANMLAAVTNVVSLIGILVEEYYLLALVPLAWTIGFKCYSSFRANEGYDVQYYKNLTKDNLIAFFIILCFSVLWYAMRSGFLFN